MRPLLPPAPLPSGPHVGTGTRTDLPAPGLLLSRVWVGCRVAGAVLLIPPGQMAAGLLGIPLHVTRVLHMALSPTAMQQPLSQFGKPSFSDPHLGPGRARPSLQLRGCGSRPTCRAGTYRSLSESLRASGVG